MAGLLQILNCNLIEQPTFDKSFQNVYLYDLGINPINTTYLKNLVKSRQNEFNQTPEIKTSR